MAQVYVSIGSNIDRENNFRKALSCLMDRYQSLQMSTVYESKAVGFEGENFFNQVIGFKTEDPPEQVASTLREIESELGRVRGEKKFTSRTVDLDLLLHDDLIEQANTFSVPRAEIKEQAYVLQPLAEIAGDRRHPMTGERFRDLWEAFDKSTLEIWPVDFSPIPKSGA